MDHNFLINRDRYSLIDCEECKNCNNGCNCKQPKKIYKEGLSTLIAEWPNKDNIPDEDGVINYYITDITQH